MGALRCASRTCRNNVLNQMLYMGCCFMNPNHQQEEEERHGTPVDEGGSAARLW
jgi:hypothetical protein